jgi:hypothetical protein
VGDNKTRKRKKGEGGEKERKTYPALEHKQKCIVNSQRGEDFIPPQAPPWETDRKKLKS